jgi:hypothetical protein
VCPFFADIIMPLSNESPFLAAKPVLNRKGFIASITTLRESPRAEAISDGEVVEELFT